MAKAENRSKKNTSKTTRKSKKKATDQKQGTNLKEVIAFVKSDRARKILGVLGILFSVFLLIAFVSHFFTGQVDQSVVDGASQPASNWLGSLGAWFADRFVSRGFGIMALLIPVFLGLLSVAVFENRFFRLVWRMLKYFLFGLLWGSALLAFLEILFTKKVGDLGGGFGWYLNEELLFPLINKIGMGLVLLASLVIFLIATVKREIKLAEGTSKLLALFKRKTGLNVEEEEVSEDENNSASESDSENKHGEEETDTPEKETTEPEVNKEEELPDFVVSVRKAEDGHEISLDDSSEKNQPESENKTEALQPETSTQESKDQSLTLDPTVSATNIPDSLKPDNKDESGGLELQIEVVADDPDLELEDNIQEVDQNKYEKIVPESDKPTLPEGEDVGDWEEYDPTRELSNYQYPPIELLKAYDSSKSKEVNRSELEENKNKIVKTLQHYKIEITHIKATIGPTVTLYEIVPAPGVRISKIRNLEDDIALSLAALGIRIIAPIPGKGTIGIEIPNSNPEIVSMRSTLATEKFRSTKAELPLALGRTISNEVYIADLAKMPHLLIAGATGQGKSVGINGIISSLLYKKHPAQVKFVLIDPKKVELNLYQALESHFLAKLESHEDAIITDTKQVIHVLNSLCIEMDARYDLLKKAKVRNLREYNTKFLNRRLNPRKGHRFMPYIVLVIDEFADLMMTAGKEIETPIARLAQLARAIGIHLILATQRPSVNVITGIIKANFPARISFRVTSKIDSRTILDTGGADQLIGRGDLLLSTGSEVVRIQNAFIDTPEVDKLVDFIGEQQGYPQPYFLPEVPMDDADDKDDIDLGDERDELFPEAAKVIVRHQQGSTSLLQRKLKLGYNRAGRIIDQLEAAGIVGPFSGSKARDVLVKTEMDLEQILEKLN